MPFVDSVELALILGEPHATVHRAVTGLLADALVGRVSHGTTHLPSSQRYYLTSHGIRKTAEMLDLVTPSDCRPSAIMGHVRGVENPRV